MCLITNIYKPVIARNDKIVYKLMFLIDVKNELFINTGYDPGHFKYKLGREEYVQMVLIKNAKNSLGTFRIDKGLHSWDNMKYIRGHHDLSMESLRIVQCTIPKGAEYYVGKWHQLVSNKIIPIKSIYKPIQR